MQPTLRRTALPVLALGVCAGLVMPSTSAQAVTRPAAVASASAAAPVARVAAVSPAKPRPRIAPPKKVTLHEFDEGKVTVSWSKIRGVKWYQLHAYKTDPKSKFSYPFNVVPGSNFLTTTKRLSNTFVNNFAPHRDAKRLQALPWRITVAAKSPNKAHRDSSPKAPTYRVHDKIVYKIIVIKKKPSAKQVRGYKSVVRKCVGAGAAAAVTVGGGAAILAATAIWVPGVNAVSWGAVAVLTVGAGVTGTLACFVQDKINPDSSLHLRVAV